MDSSIRHHAQLKQLFINAESRQLDSNELELYANTVPDYAYRAKAAYEIKLVQSEVVDLTIKDIFSMYPFLQNHELAQGKCYRDVNYVVAYITLAMLMNDPEWLRDKLLVWLKTILQAFCFPVRDQKAPILTQKLITIEADQLPSPRSSIHDTYSRLKHYFNQNLSTKSYELIEPLLQMACDILAAE
ncbi:MAG: hypothetical protein RL637_952 [Pseudomonadota bacterium]|jgi:hypothetical protein